MNPYLLIHLCVVFYSFSCSGNDVSMLLEPLYEVTRAFTMVINALYDERVHVGVLKTNLDHKLYVYCTFISKFYRLAAHCKAKTHKNISFLRLGIMSSSNVKLQ